MSVISCTIDQSLPLTVLLQDRVESLRKLQNNVLIKEDVEKIFLLLSYLSLSGQLLQYFVIVLNQILTSEFGMYS